MTPGTCGIAIVLTMMLAAPAVAADYDLVILNGRVIDQETMLDATLNVGVQGGTIDKKTLDRQHKRCGVTPGGAARRARTMPRMETL